MDSTQATNPVSITDIPSGWGLMPIDSLCERVTSGATPLRSRGDYFRCGTIPWFKTQELKNGWLEDSLEHITDLALKETSAKLFPKNTVLIAMYGDGKTITSTGILKQPAATNQACCAMIVNTAKCEFRYLFYALNLHRSDFIRLATGGAQRNLSVGLISKFHIRVPPLPEQRAIAALLGSLDAKIDLNRQTNETLEAMARAIFKSWFVDFDFGRVKSEGTESFSSIATVKRESINPTEYPTESFDYYSIPAFDEARLPFVEMGSAIKSNKFIVRKDSVLLSKLNPRIPRVWMPLLDSGSRAICSTEFLVLQPKGFFSREFIYDLCTSQSFVEEFATMVTGTSGSHQRVKPEYLEQMQVPIADSSELARHAAIARPLHLKVSTNLRENSILAALRDTLLPQLMSGTIRLKHAEMLVEAHA